MSDTQSTRPEFPRSELPRAIHRPHCPRCHARMVAQRIVPSRSGFEHWTLRCTKCGNVHQAQVAIDPMKSDAMGWLDSELVPPK